jgi:hypothetical protein
VSIATVVVYPEDLDWKRNWPHIVNTIVAKKDECFLQTKPEKSGSIILFMAERQQQAGVVVYTVSSHPI